LVIMLPHNNDNRFFDDIKRLCSGVSNCTVHTDCLSLYTKVHIKFTMDVDFISDCVYCFLNSTHGRLFMEEHEFEFDSNEECFSKNCHYAMNEMEIASEILCLFSSIENAIQKDKSYFSEEERPDVLEKLKKSLRG